VPHLCYLHTPARYLWSQVDEYARSSTLQRAGLSLWLNRLREADVEASRSVTRFISNSTHTAREARRCYGRDSTVIFPPVDTMHFTPPERPRRENFWLCVGAIEPYKRTEVAMQAAAIAGARLLVVGKGTQLGRVRGLAGNHVEFLSDVSNEELRELYQSARLLIFPQVEDFGIVAVEAQACGLPVVARGKGGALDTVIDDRTGVLCATDDPECFAQGARRCPHPDGPDIRAHATTFARARFEEKIVREIRQALRGGQDACMTGIGSGAGSLAATT
jgi:glycosyltransferase involved in cell wall biosynthesis